ncbi:MAG: helix-hairpin-helix domain-containing protein [Planctomycetes bacterium]|nr:helix-hairpin-helix domain-containing protein [Planctomycetota bacterium]
MTVGLVALGVHAWLRPVTPVTLEVAPARVDVNLASRHALTVLPGVGPATAERIVAGRPYRSLDEVRAVLGDALFARVEEHLALTPLDVAPVSSR